MIIKCMAYDSEIGNQQHQINSAQSNTIKLPAIQSSAIPSSRSANKTKLFSVFDSFKHLTREPKQKEQMRIFKQNYKKPMQVNKMMGNPLLSEMKKKRSKRIRTDLSQNSQESVEKRSFNSKKSIAQKILKITRELGMNSADYKNYMKTARKPSKANIMDRFAENGSNRSAEKEEVNGHSLPLDEPVDFQNVDKSAGKGSVKIENKDELMISVLKFDLKKKPGVKLQQKYQGHQKETNKKQKQGKEAYDMNKSIRGWTKYGKIQQEIQS